MGPLDKEIFNYKSKPWLISLICTIFVIYPNIAWFHCELINLPVNDQFRFLLFTIFRSLYFWGVIWLLLRYNLYRLATPFFTKRAYVNALFTVAAFLLYWLVTQFTPRYDRFLSILIFQFIVIGLMVIFIGHIFLLYTDQREKEQEIEQLRFENLQSRCEALANQINPHFFFNALNGISALVRKNNNENTLLYVSRLSDIFRYILQSDKKGAVSLTEELDFIEAFRYVMEARFANKLAFEINVPESERDSRLPVLSLLPLIENVTVHNAIDSEHRMIISIFLNERGELVISNPVYPKMTPPDTNGTGLKNLGNRFKLLMGKQIRVVSDERTFSVYLPLK